MHLSADYWADKSERPDDVLGNRKAIRALTRNAFANDPHMVDLTAYPDALPCDEVAEIIASISKPFDNSLSYLDGGIVEKADYERYTANLNLAALQDVVSVRFGMVLARADMRTWPTKDVVYRSQETIDLDRFQENGLFPADVVAVLHESADAMWYFVQSFNYAAWVQQDKIAIGGRAAIEQFGNSARFIVVTGSKVTTNFNPHAPEISELQLDMGVRLPLLDPDETPHDVDGQNPYTSYPVELPIAGDDDKLAFKTVLIARSQDVSLGFLPYTRRNIIQQAFKFLGERYGWGHSYNARDCTGLVSEVFKTFGILLPRNSEQQGHSPVGDTTHFGADDSPDMKLRAIAAAGLGDLLYSSGHVMLYLGSEEGEPYIIHDLSGAGWEAADGEYQKGVLNGVSVTPLSPVQMPAEDNYLKKLYAIKRIQ